MDTKLLPSGSAENLSRQGMIHHTLSQSGSAVDKNALFVPLDTYGLLYEQLIEKQYHSNRFVSLMDLNPTFNARENLPCYSAQLSQPASESQEFDMNFPLGQSPNQSLVFPFHDEASYDAFSPEFQFNPNITSQITSSLPQQLYDPLESQLQQDPLVIDNDFTRLPSLAPLSYSSCGDLVMGASQLYQHFELEPPTAGNSGSGTDSLSQYQYDVPSLGDTIQLNPSLVGYPSVQMLSAPPASLRADSGDPLGVLPPFSVSRITPFRPCDSSVHTAPSTVQSEFPATAIPSNKVQVVPEASHNPEHCPVPMCTGMQSAPVQVTSRGSAEGHGLFDSGKVIAEYPISETLQALKEYRQAQKGPSNGAVCRERKSVTDECVRPKLSGGSALDMDPCRKQARLGKRGRVPARTEEQLPISVKNSDENTTQFVKRKEKSSKNSQLQIEAASIKGPSCTAARKKRVRKTVERKLNEAILIFNNMDEVPSEFDGEDTGAHQKTAAGVSTSTDGTPHSSNINLGMESATNLTTEDYVVCAVDSPKKHEADDNCDETIYIIQPLAEKEPLSSNSSPALEIAASVNGDPDSVIVDSRLSSFHPDVAVQDGSVVGCNENVKLELAREEIPSDSAQIAKVATGVDIDDHDSGKKDQGISEPMFSSLCASDHVHASKLLTSPGSAHTMEVMNATGIIKELEADTNFLEDRRKSQSASDEVVKDETAANVKAEDICGTDVCSDTVIAVKSHMKSEKRGDFIGAAVDHGIATTVNKHSNSSADADRSSFGKDSKPSDDFSKGNSEENCIQKDESGPEKDENSSSTSDATSKIVTGLNSREEKDEGSCDMDLSPLLVMDIDPSDDMKYKRKADASFFETPNSASFIPASDVDQIIPANGIEGSIEADDELCKVELSTFHVSRTMANSGPGNKSFLDSSGKFGFPKCREMISSAHYPQVKVGIRSAVRLDPEGEADSDISQKRLCASSASGSDPTRIDIATNSSMEIDVQCSELLTPSISGTIMEYVVSNDCRKGADIASLISRLSEPACNSPFTDEIAIDIFCSELRAPEKLKVETASSSDSPVQKREISAIRSNLEENSELCRDDMSKLGSRSPRMEAESAKYCTRKADVNFSALNLYAPCTVEPMAKISATTGLSTNSWSDLDVESSTFDASMKMRRDKKRKGKAVVPLKSPYCGRQNETFGEEHLEKEILNPYQQKIMKILTDFIESGYGAGAQPQIAIESLTHGHEEPDLFAELSKGTYVVPSPEPKQQRDKVQKGRWKSRLRQGRVCGILEAGCSNSSSSHPVSGICNSDAQREKKILYRPPPEKVHRTRSRSRSGWGGLRKY